MGKKGDPQLKRKLAHLAKRLGKSASELGGTTGAPKQRKHLGHKVEHEEKLEARHRFQPSPPARGSTPKQTKPNF